MTMLTDVQLTQLLFLTAFLTVIPLAETIASHARLQARLSAEIGLRDALNRTPPGPRADHVGAEGGDRKSS
jgi:hypothetical protein